MYSDTENDRLFDALFSQAVIDNYEDEIRSIPSESELAKLYTFSDLHTARMEKLIRSAERFEKMQTTIKWIRRSAAVMVVALTVLFGALMTVSDVRAVIVKTVIEWFDKFTKFTSEQADPDEMEEWAPSYIPEGFLETARDNFAGMLTISYENENTVIDFTCVVASGSISVDNENQNYFIVEEKDTTYHIFENREIGEMNIIVWDQESYRFSIKSLLPVSDILQVAKSVEKKYLKKFLNFLY